MKKSRRTYNGVHLNKKSNTQDVVEQSLTTYRKHLQANGLTGSAYGNMPALQQGDHSRVSARPVPFVGNAHQPPLQDIHPHCKNNYCPDRHGHACIILKA